VHPTGEDSSAALWITKKDADSSKLGMLMRLMELFNVKIEKANVYSAEGIFVSESYEDARRIRAQLIHWIPIGNDTPCKVVMPDATVAEGVAEGACKALKLDDMIQFERFGFVRIDEVGNELKAYFAHK
jgi:glutamyl-tRNA synthetase